MNVIRMDAFFSGSLLFLESTFILVLLLILHGAKKIVGSAPLYMIFGVVILYAHFIAAAGIRYILPGLGVEMSVSSTALLLPCMVMFLIVYISDGTLETQRMIFGMLLLCGVMYYLQTTGLRQTSQSGPSVLQDSSAAELGNLFSRTILNLASVTVALLFDMLIMPIVFQRMRNSRCGLFISILIALIVGQAVDMLIYLGVRYWGQPQYLMNLVTTFLPRSALMIWFAFIASIYLRRLPVEAIGTSRSTIDIILAFFGSYGKAKSLERNLHESEERYRTIIQNAGDLVLLTGEEGEIIDANRTALSVFQVKNAGDLAGTPLEKFADPGDEPDLKNAADSGGKQMIRMHSAGSGALLEFRVNQVMLEGEPAYLLIGRDITERERLAKEREEWRSELAHTQRLEAIGRLAGGIAHDFNNYIHSINGQLDLIYMGEVTDESMVHLKKIDAIASQAGKLTAQLLGYARKGRRQNRVVSLERLVKDAMELFLPDSRAVVTSETRIEQRPLGILCDPTQIQQALLNLLINARDAVSSCPEEKRFLRVSAGTCDFLSVTPHRPTDAKLASPDGFFCGIRVTDSGPGVDPAIVEKIFEPFFTTKPVGMGTGMGLSMAYGVAVEHGGWIQYEPAPEGGASFTIILPVSECTTMDLA